MKSIFALLQCGSTSLTYIGSSPMASGTDNCSCLNFMVLDVGWHIGSFAAEAFTFCARPEHQLTASGGCSSSPFGNTQRTNAISSFVWLNLHSQHNRRPAGCLASSFI